LITGKKQTMGFLSPDVPAAPPPPPPPPAPPQQASSTVAQTAAAQRAAAAAAAGSGFASTLKTGAQGDTKSTTTGKSTLGGE
jgi:hypothetical protein